MMKTKRKSPKKQQRPMWKGTLRFRLVSIPVRVFQAKAQGSDVELHWLHDQCHSPIHYAKVCPVHGEVSNEEIVSAYRYARDQYIVIEPEEMDKLRKRSNKILDLEAFIAPETLDRIYDTDKSYYVLPDGAAAELAYAVIQDTMRRQDRFGIARIVLFRKEQVVLLRAVDHVLLMTVLSHAQRFRRPVELTRAFAHPKPSARERDMAQALIDSATVEDFDFAQYKDTYADELKAYVEAKAKGRAIAEAPRAEEPAPLNFMEALRKSVRSARSVQATATHTQRRHHRRRKAS